MVRYPSPPPPPSSSDNDTSSPHRPSSWREYKDEASTYFNEGNYHDALSSYRNALNPMYHIPDAEKQIILSNIVCTRLKIGGAPMASAAIEEAKQCIALNSRWAKGHVRLASAYIALGNHSNDACNSLQRALQLEPGNKVARQMLLAELRRDREGRSEQPFDTSGTSSATVEPSAPPMEDHDDDDEQLQHEDDFVYNNGTNVHSSTSTTSQPPPFNPDSYSTTTTNPNTPSTTASAPPPNDYMGSPTASAPTPPRPHNPYNNNQDNIDESLTLSQRLQFHYIKLTTWYNEALSDDFKTLFKVMVAIVVLYVAFGGRFGLDAILGGENGQKRGNRGNYGVDNVYEKYRTGEVGYNDGADYASSSSSYSRAGNNDRTTSYERGKSGYSSSSSSSYSNDGYIYSTSRNHHRRSSSSRSNSHSYHHMPNLFDGSPASLVILLGIGFICHKLGINPFHVFMLLRMGNRRARGGGGRGVYMGYGGMAGMGMGYGMANQMYRRHYGAGAGMGGRRR